MNFRDSAGRYLRLRSEYQRACNAENTPRPYLERLRADLAEAERAMIASAPDPALFIDTLPASTSR